MKNIYKGGFSPVIVIIIAILVIFSGFYFFYPSSSDVEIKNDPTPAVQTSNEPVGFEEEPANLPATDTQSGGLPNPNIPVFTPEDILGAEVIIKNFSFGPATVTIKAGESVQWINNDSVGHTVTADDGSFDSGNEAPGDIYTHKFEKPGTYTYFCKPHPNMKGTVIVTQ